MSVLPTTLVPPETARDVLAFARTLVAAVRARQLYTAEHPAAEAASERLRSAMVQVSGHSGLELGVTPGGLMANGEPLPADQRMSEAAALLHERDILRLRVLHAPAVNEVSDFLHLLGFDGNALRREGGPSRVWENFGYRWLEVDQIDYDLILRDAPAGTVPANGASGRGGGNGHGSAGQDDVWASLVRSIAGGRNTTESAAQKRLVDIARSAESIRELASQASSTHTAPNGAAMAAAQAATVLATFDRLVEAVRTNAPDDLSVAVKNVAKAATELDPALVMRAVGESAESGMGAELTATLGRYFDDSQVARMLARSLAAEGRATGRMAAALSTLTPDADRRDRVVRLAQSMSASTDKPSGLETMWTSLQQFMSGPSDNTYVSDGYSATLEQAETRSHRLTLDVPAELDAWVHTVSSESVRSRIPAKRSSAIFTRASWSEIDVVPLEFTSIGTPERVRSGASPGSTLPTQLGVLKRVSSVTVRLLSGTAHLPAFRVPRGYRYIMAVFVGYSMAGRHRKSLIHIGKASC